MSVSIAIQAVASQAANLSIASPAASVSSLSRPLQKPVAIVVASEYQQGTRNARIERLASGELCVLCYDAATDYNELLVRQSMQAAMESAEAWVKRQF